MRGHIEMVVRPPLPVYGQPAAGALALIRLASRDLGHSSLKRLLSWTPEQSGQINARAAQMMQSAFLAPRGLRTARRSTRT